MMIIRATAVPLACHPYSNSSRVVQWLTRRHGRVSTLLKGALRPKSPFLGEYELFGTSELLYYTRRTGTLHLGKECALLRPRTAFRTDWRAMQAASYITALISAGTPDEAPQPGLFEFFEELLDLAEEHGGGIPFLSWAELRFCDHSGHRPRLGGCAVCGTEAADRFSAQAGGTVCIRCARKENLPTLECPPDVLAILRSWQRARQPETAKKTRLTDRQENRISAILGAFMTHHFNLSPDHRRAACSRRLSA